MSETMSIFDDGGSGASGVYDFDDAASITDSCGDLFVGDFRRNLCTARQVPISRVAISDGFSIDCDGPPPNAWHRFWQRALLGWRWLSE